MAKEKDIPQITNSLIIVLQLMALACCFYIITLAHTTMSLVVLAIVFGIVMNSVYSIIHEAHHGLLFRKRFFNDTFGILMSLFFPAAFHLLRQGHLGHHVRNRSDDGTLNGLPSLHAGLSFYSALFATRLPWAKRFYKTHSRYPFAFVSALWSWVALILFATIATKQHYAIDLIPGLVIAFLSYRIVTSNNRGQEGT